MLIVLAAAGCASQTTSSSAPPKLPPRIKGSTANHSPVEMPLNTKGRTIIPGQGIGGLRLGMRKAAALLILGRNGKEISYATELESYKQGGSNVNEELVFLLKFDTLVEFNRMDKKDGLPVYRAFFRKGRLVYLILSSYGGFTFPPDRFTLMGTAGFGPKSAIFLNLGAYRFKKMTGYGGDYYYLEKGIELITAGGRVRAIHLFPPVEPAAAHTLWENISPTAATP